MVTLCDVSFSYGKRQILKDLSFSVGPGECLVLAGPNGSGKSTAVSLIAGVLRPDSGVISVQGSVGFVPQGTALFEDMSVGENLRFFAGIQNCDVPEKLPFGVERYRKLRVCRLSGGMKKQVSIACALLGEPQVILMDEPCASLDICYREELTAIIRDLKAKGCAVIYVGHEPMEFAPFYDRLVFLKDGQTAGYTRQQLSGNPAEDSRLFAQYMKLFEWKEVGGSQ